MHFLPVRFLLRSASPAAGGFLAAVALLCVACGDSSTKTLGPPLDGGIDGEATVGRSDGGGSSSGSDAAGVLGKSDGGGATGKADGGAPGGTADGGAVAPVNDAAMPVVKLDAAVNKLDGAIVSPVLDAARAADVPVVPIPVGPTQGLTIPSGHPRLWWNPARIATGKAYLAKSPYTPRYDNENPLAWATHYILTGEPRSARAAIDWAVKFTLPPLNGGTSDQARWNGENSIVVYDWCFDAMTPVERKNILDKWGDLTTKLLSIGAGAEANNYFWGYIRNDIELGIAAAGEHADAARWLENGLKTRWSGLFVPYANADGLGGVPAEGTQYGRYMLGYSVMPTITAGLMGRSLLTETNFFRDAVYYLVYATLPGPTTRMDGQAPRYDLFPFAEDDQFVRGSNATNEYYGDFLTAMALQWPAAPVGGHARHWLNTVKPPTSLHTKAVDVGNPETAFDALPLDYYAPGPGHFYGRNSWAADATVVDLQLKLRGHADHQHQDLGSFQMWRSGRFATRKSAGYGDEIAGYRGQGKSDDYHAPAHNGLLLGGIGQANAHIVGPPKVLRLESRADFSFAAIDLSAAYRASAESSYPTRDDNPFAKTVIREFVFVRALEALVIFDRLEASSDSLTRTGWTGAKTKAEDVAKTFLVHFEKMPEKIGNNNLLLTNGPQALRVTTLVPADPVVRIIAEGSIVSGYAGQFRAEIETSGAAQSHFLHVLSARDTASADLVASVAETATTYTVTLQHPTKGNATLVFTKGMASTGGAVGVSTAAVPVTVPLTTGVQTISVTNSGPRWE